MSVNGPCGATLRDGCMATNTGYVGRAFPERVHQTVLSTARAGVRPPALCRLTSRGSREKAARPSPHPPLTPTTQLIAITQPRAFGPRARSVTTSWAEGAGLEAKLIFLPFLHSFSYSSSSLLEAVAETPVHHASQADPERLPVFNQAGFERLASWYRFPFSHYPSPLGQSAKQTKARTFGPIEGWRHLGHGLGDRRSAEMN